MDERTIELTKIVDAPMDLVFRAFTEPDDLARWWGPEGFGVSAVTSDARRGGLFRIVMRGPDGMDMPVDGTYREFDPPRRLVTESTAMGPDGEKLLEAVTTVDLVNADGKTEIRLRATAVGLVPAANPALAGMEAGWAQSLRRLDDHVTGAADRQIVTIQLVEASPTEVFEVFTTPEHLARWWGPRGYTLISYKADARVGGTYRFGVRSPENTEHWAHGTYREITPPETLAFTHAWENPDGSPKHETVVTLTFAEQGEKTKLTLKQTLFETVTSRDLHRGGWSSTFELLEEYLATL